MTAAPEVTANAPHIPVLLAEVLTALAIQPGDLVVDATFGAGGYTRAFLDAGATVHAFDRDPDAIAAAQKWVETLGDSPRLVLHSRRFSEMVAALAEVGVKPDAVAGHSLGEYSALVASGVLTLAQATPLVRLRAQAMQEAVPVGTGAMAAILGMDAARVAAGCLEVTQSFGAGSLESVQAANFNDPAQTVISGSKAAVDKACELLKAAGAKRALLLPVSAPFHSSLMKPAAERLRERGIEIARRTVAKYRMQLDILPSSLR